MTTKQTRRQISEAIAACLDKKAEELTILELEKDSGAFTDYFVICSGTNPRQIQAIADEVELRLKRSGPYRRLPAGGVGVARLCGFRGPRLRRTRSALLRTGAPLEVRQTAGTGRPQDDRRALPAQTQRHRHSEKKARLTAAHHGSAVPGFSSCPLPKALRPGPGLAPSRSTAVRFSLRALPGLPL